jgi:outer membrane beta-barrel protein
MGVFAFPLGVLAKEDYRDKSAYGPIQKRLYTMNHEVSVGWTYLPLDPYHKGYGVAIGYTIHFNHIWALELFRFGVAYNVDSSLKEKLLTQVPDVSPSEFPGVVAFENTNLLLKILYGKQTFLNRTVLHYELFATAGAALLYRNPFNLNELDMDNVRYEFGVNAGMGIRFWLDTTWSLRVDLRDTVMLLCINRAEAEFENSVEIGLSLSVNL